MPSIDRIPEVEVPSDMTASPPVARIGDRALFPTLKARAYLNHAGIAPPSTAVTAAVSEMLQTYAAEGTGAIFHYRKVMEGLRRRLGTLLGVASDQIAFTTNTSQGVINIALCLPWRPGATVICFEGEFPANVTPWQQAAKRHGLSLKMQPLQAFATDEAAALNALEEVLAHEDVQLVAVSSVQFQTGLRMPIEAITKLCHRHGAEIFVDAIQSVGVIPTDLGALGVDYASGGGHKWLMGLEGTGWLYAHPERAKALRPEVAGWLSHEDAISFLFQGEGHLRYDRPIRNRIGFVEAGMPNIAGIVSLDAATAQIQHLGVAAIWKHLTHYLDQLEAGLLSRGFESLRATSPSNQSAILSVTPPNRLSTVTLGQQLEDKGITCAIPDGKLRFAPHWPNSQSEVGLILHTIDECLRNVPAFS